MINFNLERFRGKTVHLVHAESYREWQVDGFVSPRDFSLLSRFFEIIGKLKLSSRRIGARIIDVEDTQDLYGARSGDRITVGGAIWGACPMEHGDFLEDNGVVVDYDKEISLDGFQDPVDEVDPQFYYIWRR